MVKVQTYKFYSFISICIISLVLTSSKKTEKVFETCQVKAQCLEQPSEVERWECFGKYAFRPTDNAASELFVEHDCGGVGWGNSIRGVVNAFALAAVLNRRVVIKFSPGDKPFYKLWNPPYNLTSWDYGTTAIRAIENNIPRKFYMFLNYYYVADFCVWIHLAEYGDSWDWVGHPSKDQWSYEKYGRPPNRWAPWVKQLETSEEKAFEYKKMLLNSGICANDPEIFRTGDCVSKTFPLFDQCINSGGRHSYLPDPILFVPFYYSIFAKPSPLMVRMLNKVRRRLSLPKLKHGFEPRSGMWGLQVIINCLVTITILYKHSVFCM